VIPPVIADTGGLLRALARTAGGKASFREYQKVPISATDRRDFSAIRVGPRLTRALDLLP
jgi:hypothetical protein